MLSVNHEDSSLSSLFTLYNTHTSFRTTSTIQTNENWHSFFIWIAIEKGHILIYSVDKTRGLVVTVELFLNIFSFIFVPTPNISLRFTRFRKSYVNGSAFVLIKVTLLFCLMCTVQSSNVPFLQLFVPNDVLECCFG